MPLAAGARLGPYEIVAPLGAGGMGEVYRARDTRLDRIVAVKVLPADLAADAQFRERFEREARVISSLSHPHICPLFDVGNHDGTEFLVMEHLDGETLAARLERGPVPFDQALTIAIEIASALDAAHRAGIVHRDLKPANIFLTKTGARLLDFGLAKSNARAISSSAVRSIAGMPTALPTTPPAATLTAQGTILGTFQYMAPEQLEGQDADARTDVFAFGCVLFEMMTGRKAFSGKTQVSLIGAILKEDPPPVSTVQALSPAAFDFVVRKCLAKDPDRRWQTAADLVSQLEWIAQGGGTQASPGAAKTPPATRRLALVIAAVAIVAAAVGGAAGWFSRRAAIAVPGPIGRFPVVLPPDQRFTRVGRHFVAISPDGTKIVYVANTQLYLRTIDQIEPTPIRGTNVDPIGPFFSPDGQWVGFYAGNQLRKIAIAGGAAVKLCDAVNPFGATWVGDRVLFGQGVRGVFEVSAAGGTPTIIAKVDAQRGEVALSPQLLPDGETLLFTRARGQNWDEAQAVVQSLKTGTSKVVVDGATDARYVETGHIVFGHDGSMLAVPFDVRTLAVTGGPVALVEGVGVGQQTGAMQFALSRTGTATFVPGSSTPSRTLAWIDRKGVETFIAAGLRPFQQPRISPDGTRVAVEIADRDQAIWIWEFARDTITRLTFGRAGDSQPRWMPDGRHILYSSNATGDRGVFMTAADGTGAPEQLTKVASARRPSAISPDGQWLVAGGGMPETAADLSLVRIQGDHRVQPLLHSAANEGNGEIAPDGRWIAYQSDESGRPEIYVRPFPDVERGRWQLSSGGGSVPRWSRDGKEIFFAAGPGGRGVFNGTLMSVAVRTDGSTFIPEKPVALLTMAGYGINFDVAPDGRFLFVKNSGATQELQQLIVVQNWIEELKARVASK